LACPKRLSFILISIPNGIIKNLYFLFLLLVNKLRKSFKFDLGNLRLLFLTATPMFNSSKEIIWILNMMNMNDKRSIVKSSDVFDSNDNLLPDGKEILIQKSTGYISYVRGENPYTFPFRIYPNIFFELFKLSLINIEIF
jgi:hypothetical protein